MDSATLLDLVQSIQHAHARVSQLAREQVPEVAPLIAHERSLLETLVAELKAREAHVAQLSTTLADRLNNLLMAVQTVSDLLRNTPDEVAAARLRRHLDDTVGDGRESLKRLRDAVGLLR